MSISGGVSYTGSLSKTRVIALTGAGGAGAVGSVDAPEWARKATVTFLSTSETVANADVFTVHTNLKAGSVTSPNMVPKLGTTPVTTGDMFDDWQKEIDSAFTSVGVTVATAILPDASTANFAVTFTG